MDLFSTVFYLILLVVGYKAILRSLKIPYVSNLDSRWILITGCDTGFGNAIAKRLDSLGCNVIAACLTESGETELRKSCSNKLHTIHMDVTKPESVKKAYSQVIGILPFDKGLWGLINNAGIPSKSGPVEWMTLEDYQKVSSVNLFGLIDVTLTFLPLIKKEKGRIVNTASMAGRTAQVFTGPYCISKYGVEAFSDHLRRDMSVFGVSVSIVEPSLFATNMTQAAVYVKPMKDTYNSLPQKTREEYGQEYLQHMIRNAEEMVQNLRSNDITLVLDAYTHGLLGIFPCARYTMGKPTMLIWAVLLLQSLPEWISDPFFALILKSPKPAACK